MLISLNKKNIIFIILKLNNIKRILPKKMNKNSLNKVTDKIYLGDIKSGNDINFLKEENISNVLSLTGDIFSPKYPKKLKISQKIINIDDSPKENILKFFKECILYIENSDKILVHCMAGVSRSATIVIAYLMWKTHASYIETKNFVKNRRNIYPNDGFTQQLIIFEKMLKDKDYNLDKIDFKHFCWNL